MKAIIVLPLTNSKNTPPQGKFFRSEKHNAHIFEGRELGLEEFNKVVDKALELFPDRFKRVTVRLVSENVAEAIAGVAPDPEEDDQPPAQPSRLRVPVQPSKKRHARRKPGHQLAIA